MRLVDSIFGLLIFGTSHVAGWAISPRPIVVEENTKASDLLDGGIIISIASDSSGVTDYLLSGTPEDTAPFELKASNTCGGTVKSCADLKLRDQWQDDNGNVVNVLDRESKSTYTMTLKAVTSDNQIQEESTVVVTVRDSNDNQPVFTPASKEIRCKENSVHGSKCGRVTATDADSSYKGYNEVEYSIPTTSEIWTSRDGNEAPRNLGMFRVDATTGEITLNNPGNNWDAEKYEKVEITVRAQDAPGQMARTGPVDEQITIFIDDENDNRATANEYPRNGLKVGELSALFTQMTLPGKDYTFAGSDDDVEADNNRVTFEVISPNDSPFSITSIGNSNNAYLVVNKTLDYETTPKYELTIRAANRQAKSNVDRMSETFTVQVDIEDENEPPIWSNNKVVFNENVRAGAGPSNGIHPHAEDPDFGGISAITYTKVADPENYFSIDKKTGQITFSPRNSDDVLDRECEHCNWKEGYYNLTLEACDEESLCSQYHQRIDIVDVDDSVPIVNPPKDGFNVCTKPKNGIVWKELEISDRDDCRVNHCQSATAQVEIEGQYRRTFDLVRQNNIMYELRLRDPNQELETKTYEIQVRATADGRSQTSIIRLRVCSRADGAEKPSEGCQMTITAGPGLAMSSLMAIIAAILSLILLIVSLVIHKQRKDRNSPKAGLLDDIDDETGNIMVYSNEGGGEEDQVNYKLKLLKNCYDTTGSLKCLTVSITHYDDQSNDDRLGAERDNDILESAVEKRGFDCIKLVGRVTLKEFRCKLQEIVDQIQNQTDRMGMFILAISCHGTENDELSFSDDSPRNKSRCQILDLIQPVLNCPKLAGVAKVFVLNHCRGLQNFNLAQKVCIDGNNNLNGSETNSGHLLDDCLFFYSTAPGNPAVRNTHGSLYFQQFAFALDILDKTDDSNDLDLKIKEYFNGRSFESNIAGSKRYFYIAPYTENHLKLKLYFPTKLY